MTVLGVGAIVCLLQTTLAAFKSFDVSQMDVSDSDTCDASAACKSTPCTGD